MKRTWTLMIGLMLLLAVVCSGQIQQGLDAMGWPSPADTLCAMSASLCEAAGFLIAPIEDWNPTTEPAPVQTNVAMNLAAQRIACGDAVRNSIGQIRDMVPQMLPGFGEAVIPPIVDIIYSAQPIAVVPAYLVLPPRDQPIVLDTTVITW